MNSLELAAPSDDEAGAARYGRDLSFGRRVPAWRLCRYETGRFPCDRLVKFYGLGDINQAIAGTHHGTTIKPILRVSA